MWLWAISTQFQVTTITTYKDNILFKSTNILATFHKMWWYLEVRPALKPVQKKNCSPASSKKEPLSSHAVQQSSRSRSRSHLIYYIYSITSITSITTTGANESPWRPFGVVPSLETLQGTPWLVLLLLGLAGIALELLVLAAE
jgi:hypothetical protein